MGSESRHGVILSVSSDIGMAIAANWLKQGYQVSGTFRTETPGMRALAEAGLRSIPMDLEDVSSVKEATESLGKHPWSRVVLAAGTQNPVGLFEAVDPEEWGNSIELNFVRQFQFLSWILPFRSRHSVTTPRVLAFAGGATNRATTHYSAYTVSKIASIKMIELLAAENVDVAFSILGPGWVRTKIHDATVSAGLMAGQNYLETLRHLQEDEFFPMERVVDAVNWIMNAPPNAVTGRNFSAVHDPWESENLLQALLEDQDLYKLRRAGNDRFG